LTSTPYNDDGELMGLMYLNGRKGNSYSFSKEYIWYNIRLVRDK